MSSYRITNKAYSDLILIGRFTAKKWGLAQRDFYLKQLDNYFSQIAENPRLGQGKGSSIILTYIIIFR